MGEGVCVLMARPVVGPLILESKNDWFSNLSSKFAASKSDLKIYKV